VGWASCIVNDALLLDSIRIMRNSEGAIYLQFPVKKFRGRIKYYHFRPISHEAGDVFKQAILDELKRNGSDDV
jgi:DNA-binding cell septation regulator SpoVG